MKKLKIFTWNVHGGYLNMLVKTGHNFYVPIKKGKPYNYDGKSLGYIWPKNIHEIKINQIKKLKFDLVIFQTIQHVVEEQFKVLSEAQRKLPKILIFHTPPSKRINLKKIDKKIIDLMSDISKFIHITNFNLREWKTPKNKSVAIYHGILINNKIKWKGSIKKSITIVNDLPNRPEQGFELWKCISKKTPNDLFGANSKIVGGKRTIPHNRLNQVLSKYRLYFNPGKRTSLQTTMLEAMSVGLPVVSTANTELPKIIKNNYNGFISNNPKVLVKKINLLLNDKKLATKFGKNARNTIKEKFSMERFIKEWNKLIYKVYSGT